MTDQSRNSGNRPVECWDPFVLLMVDMQNDFLTDKVRAASPLFGERVAALLAFGREQGIDILHLRAGFRNDRADWMTRYRLTGSIPCVKDTPGAAVLPFAEELAGETVIEKQTYDGFHRPELNDWLDAHAKRHILVAGLVTSVCVLLTAASAAQRGYLVSIVEDCCADTPDAHAHVLRCYPFIGDCVESHALLEHRAKWRADLQQLGYLDD